MSADSEAVGGRIREARGRAGLSQRELGERVGVKQQSVAKWEAGGSITTEVLGRVAQELGTSTDHLLGHPAAHAQLGGADASARAEVHMAASGTNLDELRRIDPEAYEAIMRQAEIALDRARDRRRRGGH